MLDCKQVFSDGITLAVSDYLYEANPKLFNAINEWFDANYDKCQHAVDHMFGLLDDSCECVADSQEFLTQLNDYHAEVNSFLRDQD